jgi:hypothetical protein
MKSSHVSVTRPGGWYASGPLVINLPGPGPESLRFYHGQGGWFPSTLGRGLRPCPSHEAIDFRCGTVDRGYVRSPADFPWEGEVPRLRFGRRNPPARRPRAGGLRVRPPYAYDRVSGYHVRDESGATGFKYGFKKLWDTPPYSIV